MCIMAKKKYSKTCTKKMKCERLMDFLVRRKKGCKRYRKHLIGEVEEYIPHNMVKFAETTETIIDIQISKKLNSIWSNTQSGQTLHSVTVLGLFFLNYTITQRDTIWQFRISYADTHLTVLFVTYSTSLKLTTKLRYIFFFSVLLWKI